jgi:hypothetical protein
MLVVVIVVAALLAGGAVVASIQLGSSRSADVSKTSMTATYCAEAGLAAAIPVIAANPALWAVNLCTTRPFSTCAQPPLLNSAAFSHDLDGDGVDDVEVVIADNDDEMPNNITVDVDRKLFVVARCLKFPDADREITELVDFSGPTPIRKLYLRTQ